MKLERTWKEKKNYNTEPFDEYCLLYYFNLLFLDRLQTEAQALSEERLRADVSFTLYFLFTADILLFYQIVINESLFQLNFRQVTALKILQRLHYSFITGSNSALGYHFKEDRFNYQIAVMFCSNWNKLIKNLKWRKRS